MAELLFALGLAAAAARTAASFRGEPNTGTYAHTSYHATGAREEWAEYRDGERDGACRRWYDDGSLRAEGRYEAGRMQGEWSFYRPDGTKDAGRSGRYEHGLRVSS